MNEKPIILKPCEIHKILGLNGEPKLTWIIRPVEDATGAFWDHAGWQPNVLKNGILWETLDEQHTFKMNIVCPYGTCGDLLWVKEKWSGCDEMVRGYPIDPPECIAYDVDKTALVCGNYEKLDTFAWDWSKFKWKPSVLMPHWASRLSLKIVSVHLIRIKEFDCDYITDWTSCDFCSRKDKVFNQKFECSGEDCVNEFKKIWNSSWGKLKPGWTNSPYVY